jgi:hypothetical protein
MGLPGYLKFANSCGAMGDRIDKQKVVIVGAQALAQFGSFTPRDTNRSQFVVRGFEVRINAAHGLRIAAVSLAQLFGYELGKDFVFQDFFHDCFQTEWSTGVGTTISMYFFRC